LREKLYVPMRRLEAFNSLTVVLIVAPLCVGVQMPARPAVQLDEAVFFPFDDFSFPFTHDVHFQLVAGEKQDPVLGLGQPGDPDADVVMFYGTVIRVGDEFRMWYMGREFSQDFYKYGPFRVCYAVSKDGIHWEKPELGLVEYQGDRKNHLVGLLQSDGSYGPIHMIQTLVLYEPEDPDPNRRFKMFYEIDNYIRTGQASVEQDTVPGLVAFSPDGLRWTGSPRNPVVRGNLEPSGLTKFDGCYYVNAHHILPSAYGGRVTVTYASYDFENWTESVNKGFRRAFPSSGIHTGNLREQVHMGASLWNRGNVVLGIYGMWHGDESDDTLKLTMDLGLIVSHDAIHFREPTTDFALIPAKGEKDGVWPALMQGQAFANVKDKTYIWYGSWDEYAWRDKNPINGGGKVRLATWDRDRLGFFHPKSVTGGAWLFGKDNPHAITRTLMIDENDTIFVNAEGLSNEGYLALELLDERFQPLSGFSGPHCAVLSKPGLRQPVHWRGKAQLKGFDKPIRIRVDWEGRSRQDVRLYAVYVSPK